VAVHTASNNQSELPTSPNEKQKKWVLREENEQH